MYRIRSREGNRTLGDERKTHDEVCGTGLSLLLCELLLEEHGSQCNRAGRCHTADHHGCHHVIVAGGDGCGTEYISRLVEGAAHIDGHHRCQNEAEHQTAGASHAGETVVQGNVYGTHDGLHHEAHDQSDTENAQHRVNQHRRNLLQCLREMSADLPQQQNQIACNEAGYQGTQETGFSLISDHAAHEADSQRRTITDGHGDEASQHRQHEAEGHAAHILEPCRQRGNCTEVASLIQRQGIQIHAEAVDQEGDGNEDTAAHHEGQHVGNAVHKLRIDLMTHTAGLAAGLLYRLSAGSAVINRHLTGYGSFQELRCLADAVGYLALNHPLAVKAIHGYLGVCCHDDAVCRINFLLGQHILRTG